MAMSTVIAVADTRRSINDGLASTANGLTCRVKTDVPARRYPVCVPAPSIRETGAAGHHGAGIDT